MKTGLLSCLSAGIFAVAAMAAPTTAPSTQPSKNARAEVKVTVKTPATSPATAPAAKAGAKTASPVSSPTTAPSTSAAKLPTPAELVAKMREQAKKQESLLKVAYFDLDTALTEKPAGFSLFGEADTLTLRSVITRLHEAKDDKDLRAVLLTIGPASSMNLAQAQELRDALSELRRAGKKTFIHADSYDTTGLLVASAATNVCMLEGGDIMIPGIGFETMFYKGGLDKLGVVADYIQIGEFKGADETYTRTGASEELRGELNKMADAIFDEIVNAISLSRGLSREQVKQLIDEAMISARTARDRGLVDHLCDQDGLRALIKEELGQDINLVHDYAAPEKPKIDTSNIFTLFASLTKKPEKSTKPAVALVYAEGVITDGDGEGGLFGGGGVGSEDMRTTFRQISRDPSIKAVVIRIDSPGGSALASEVMWQAVRRVAKEKPVVVSIGSMAASGGYYLASAGDHIFADPVGIVGSIGVVGGKFVMKDLYAKLGLTTESFQRGRNAGLFSSTEKFTDRQRRLIRNWMQETYDQFTQRVMTTRSGKIKDIDQVARGRIFTARQAKDLGMVDALGGTEAALAHAARQANLEDGAYDVRIVPQPKTLADLFGGGSGHDVSGHDVSGHDVKLPLQPKVIVSADSILRLVPASVRKALIQQVQMAELMESRPVILMSPYVITPR